MKIFSMLYKNRQAFKRDLDCEGIPENGSYFIRIYTAICDKDEAVSIAREIQAELPNATIIGASGSGIIFRGVQYESDTLIIIEEYEHTDVRVAIFSFLNKSGAQVAQEVASSIVEEDVPIMHVLCGNHYPDVHNFVMEFNKRNHTTKLCGGVVGDVLSKNIMGYVFTVDGVAENCLLTAALCSRKLHAFAAVNIAHDPISPIYQLSKCSGSLLMEIENESAVSWCRTHFGIDNLREFHDNWQLIADNDALIRFPMMLEGHGGASRFVKFDLESQSMSLYFSRLKTGTRFRIGYSSPTKCVQECSDICNQMMGTPIESLFCYSCLFRKLYMENCAEWELRPFLNYNICGVFMMGEIGYVQGANEFLNGSCCFMGVGEHESHIRPDLSVFDDLYKIKDANEVLHNFAIKRFSVATSQQNQILLEKLLSHQNEAKKLLYIDTNTGLHNTIMFSTDNEKYHFNKLCMAQIENSTLLMGQLGPERYGKTLYNIAQEVRNSPHAAAYSGLVFYYALNESSLFMTADDRISESDFMRLSHDLYKTYQFVKLDDEGTVMINRFAVVLYQPNLLESALNTLQATKNLQTHFVVCDNNELTQSLTDEINMIQVLNRVIESDGVVPYFQGIHDNAEKKIDKYEALMRLVDTDGTVYSPAAFMEVSKKYHLYSILSKKMLSKVFALFAGKKTCVSINLSAFDINFTDMQDWILINLERIGDASNFVFEILEDEEFRDMETLRDFIRKARAYGVSIAIDDFGSGYSNFMEIAKMEPDFLKVDGSIIKNIQSNDLNHKVLENIVFLGKQLQAGLVAEFVETKEIQGEIESFGIPHSQGYYFSKPVPYDQIEWADPRDETGHPLPEEIKTRS